MGGERYGCAVKVRLFELDTGNCMVVHARCSYLPNHACLKISTQGSGNAATAQPIACG